MRTIRRLLSDLRAVLGTDVVVTYAVVMLFILTLILALSLYIAD